MKTYYITGISGFLGRNITIELLKEKDISIVGFVLPNEKNLEFYKQHENITLIEGNIIDKEDVERFLSAASKGDKYLIHAAGKISVYKRNDKPTMTINVDGTRNVIDSVIDKDFKKVVFVSSVDSIPRRKGNDEVCEPDIYDTDKVVGVYSKSKVIANNIVLDAYKNHGLDVSIVLPSAMMGPNDPFNNPINLAIKKFLNDKLPAITKGGYDIADVRDVARGILSVANKGKAGESYLLSGHNISVKELIALAGKEVKKKPVAKTVPHFLIKLISPFLELHARIHHKTPLFTGFSMDCLMQNSNYSSKKAKDELGYEITPIETTMKETIEWMKESNYLNK